jgi:hypothetical protein
MISVEHSSQSRYDGTGSMTLIYRLGTTEDMRAVFGLVQRTNADFGEQLGIARFASLRDPAGIAANWERSAPVWEHVARTGEHFWIAERGGQVVGAAQSILRDDTRVLTLFYVETEQQDRGIGHQLLARAFPREGARCRALIASTHTGALVRYLKAGIYPQSPVYILSRRAERVTAPTDLVGESVTATSETLAALREIDRATLGFGRDADHGFLLGTRRGYLYRRDGRVVGYGYLGTLDGPFALHDPDDFPAVLAHAESEAAAHGDEFGLLVPLANHAAVDYLLTRGCRLDRFFLFAMSDRPFAHLDRYILTRPPLFI